MIGAKLAKASTIGKYLEAVYGLGGSIDGLFIEPLGVREAPMPAR